MSPPTDKTSKKRKSSNPMEVDEPVMTKDNSILAGMTDDGIHTMLKFEKKRLEALANPPKPVEVVTPMQHQFKQQEEAGPSPKTGEQIKALKAALGPCPSPNAKCSSCQWHVQMAEIKTLQQGASTNIKGVKASEEIQRLQWALTKSKKNVASLQARKPNGGGRGGGGRGGGRGGFGNHGGGRGGGYGYGEGNYGGPGHGHFNYY